MGTYSLHAADLLTLLASTVTPGTESEVLQVLIKDGLFPLVNSDVTKVETHLGPSASGPQPPPVNNFTVTPGEKVELITLPTSTSDPSQPFPPPPVGTGAPTVFNFTNTTPGVVFIAGDQNVTLNDFGSGGDTLIGGAGFERLHTASGANVLMAGLDVNGGNTLVGGSGADTLIGGGHSRLVAGSGNQVLMGGNLANAHDTLVGGSGADLLTVTQGDNRLVAGTGLNTLMGGSGSDTLLGGGKSSLVAGTGDQRLLGGLANGAADTLIGGSGADNLRVFFGANSLVGGTGMNTLRAGSGDDTLVGGGHSRVIADGGNTKLFSSGTNGSDTLIGGSGMDTITAIAGNNRLVTKTGNDTVTLGSGNDTLVTSAANDVWVTGGTGAFRIVDTFGGNTTISGGAGGGNVVLGATANSHESILSGAGAININSQETLADLKSNSSTAVGGLHTLTFNDGQTIIINDVNSNVTIHFAGGGTTTV